jgi:AcrR family transcriptional regulator
MAKDALNKIDEKKRERIFRNAAAEFARHGYHKANVNSIATKAGIGKGSIYLYFADKRDLYYSTFREAARIQDSIFDLIEDMDIDPVAKIEKVFEESVAALPRYRNMFKMYFDLSASGDEKSHAGLAQLLERRSADFFTKVLNEGIALGTIRNDLPVEHAAYIIDSVYSIFFAALACRYQEERFRVFTNVNPSWDGNLIEKHLREILNVLEAGIASPQGAVRTGRKRSSKKNRS